LLLMMRFEFGDRASLWSPTPRTKYVPAPNFGLMGMTRNCFDKLWRHIRFSCQPAEKPPDKSSADYWWMLVDDFVQNFNDHREDNYYPSDQICADESISRWYGLGGIWINTGLPMYVAIDRKPDNGGKFQDACDGVSEIRIRIRIVKQAEDEGAETVEGDDGIQHGVKVLLELIEPWLNTNRHVCADSYFSSKKGCEILTAKNTRFTGSVKQCTKEYLMDYLKTMPMEARGQCAGVYTQIEENTLVAFVWVVRDRHYFITNAYGLGDGEPAVRTRWRQISTEPDSEPDRMRLIIPQPKSAEMYFKCCGKIDRHNRKRQDDVSLESKIGTVNWAKRFNMSILGVTIVDTWLSWKGQTGSPNETQAEFYEFLAQELIDNHIDVAMTTRATRRERNPDGSTPSKCPSLVDPTGRPRVGIDIHLTPTKKRQKNKPAFKQQDACIVCGKKTTHVCSACLDNPDQPMYGPLTKRQPAICHANSGRNCWLVHLKEHGYQ